MGRDPGDFSGFRRRIPLRINSTKRFPAFELTLAVRAEQAQGPKVRAGQLQTARGSKPQMPKVRAGQSLSGTRSQVPSAKGARRATPCGARIDVAQARRMRASLERRRRSVWHSGAAMVKGKAGRRAGLLFGVDLAKVNSSDQNPNDELIN